MPICLPLRACSSVYRSLQLLGPCAVAAFVAMADPAGAQEVRPPQETGVTSAQGTRGVSWTSPGVDLGPAISTSPLPAVKRGFARFLGDDDSWKLLAVTGVAALASHPYDRTGAIEARQHLSPGAFRVGNLGGSFQVQMGAALGTWAIGRATGSAKGTAVGRDLLAAQVLGQTVVQGLKFSVRRPRPDGSDRLSFPSGHTASAFATATVLQRHFGWALGVPAYAFATYVGAARMSADKHHLSDVFMGAGIGLVAGRSVTVRVADRRFSLGLTPTHGGAAMTFTPK